MNRDKNLPLTETTYYILLALLKPAHGYLIMQKVEELSNQQVRIAAGTLYGAIENLLKQKFIQSLKSEDIRRKVYVITGKGKEVLRLDLERMHHMIGITESQLEL
jgi:DNA-binding PadR family transcriptional regulator